MGPLASTPLSGKTTSCSLERTKEANMQLKLNTNALKDLEKSGEFDEDMGMMVPKAEASSSCKEEKPSMDKVVKASAKLKSPHLCVT